MCVYVQGLPWVERECCVVPIHKGKSNVFVVLPAWLKMTHSHPQRPGITLHYMAHNDSQRRMKIGLTSGFSSLTHGLCGCVCDCMFHLWLTLLLRLLQKKKQRPVIWQSLKAMCTVQLGTMRCIWSTQRPSSGHEREVIRKNGVKKLFGDSGIQQLLCKGADSGRLG